MDVTPEEKKAIAALKRVAKIWPDSLWLFSASGNLCVMKKRDGERAVEPGMSTVHCTGGGIDIEYMVDKIGIENDGGDW